MKMEKTKLAIVSNCPVCFHGQQVDEEKIKEIIHCDECYYNYFYKPEHLVNTNCPNCNNTVKVAMKDIEKVIHCDNCFYNYHIDKKKGVIK